MIEELSIDDRISYIFVILKFGKNHMTIYFFNSIKGDSFFNFTG